MCLTEHMDTSYGITAEMRTLRGEAERTRAEPVMLTAILTAYLRFSGNPHRRGTFMQQGGKKATPLGSMYALADQMVATSPTMCMPGVSVHVVHDLSNATIHRGEVTYHGFPPAPWRPPDAHRFVLYAELLRSIKWDCAFAIDMSDVAMLYLPPCHALPQRLVLGSDSDGKWFHHWLRKAARINGLLDSASTALKAFLNGSRNGRNFNVGVVGGCRRTFLPLLAHVSLRFQKHWTAARPRPLSAASDMVLWNELALEQTDQRIPPLTGFPHGPVNMPMYGGSEKGSCLARYFRNASGRQRNPCRIQWFGSSRGFYWFVHKPVQLWLTTQMDPASSRYAQRLDTLCLRKTKLRCLRCVRT